MELGVAYATLQCEGLLRGGAPGVHFYTLNRSPATSAILAALQITRPGKRRPGAWPRRPPSRRLPGADLLSSACRRAICVELGRDAPRRGAGRPRRGGRSGPAGGRPGAPFPRLRHRRQVLEALHQPRAQQRQLRRAEGRGFGGLHGGQGAAQDVGHDLQPEGRVDEAPGDPDLLRPPRPPPPSARRWCASGRPPPPGSPAPGAGSRGPGRGRRAPRGRWRSSSATARRPGRAGRAGRPRPGPTSAAQAVSCSRASSCRSPAASWSRSQARPARRC